MLTIGVLHEQSDAVSFCSNENRCWREWQLPFCFLLMQFPSLFKSTQLISYHLNNIKVA